MKWLLILLLPVSVYGQVTDTTSHMIYYQRSLIKKAKIELYGYTSYDLIWASESGIGITLTIPNKRKKKNGNKRRVG
jgi:hypothetical protein